MVEKELVFSFVGCSKGTVMEGGALLVSRSWGNET
jgi:hypothetical protein